MNTEFEDFNSTADRVEQPSFDDFINTTFAPRGTKVADQQPSRQQSEDELSFNTDELYCAAPLGDTDLSGNPVRRMGDHEFLTDIISPAARNDVRGGGNLSAQTIESMRDYLFVRGLGPLQYGLRAGWLQDQLGEGFTVTDNNGPVPTMTIRHNGRVVGRVVR